MTGLSMILAKLDELRRLKASSEQIRAEYIIRRDGILASVRVELDTLRAEYGMLLQPVETQAEELQDEIKHLVRAHGQGIKTSYVSVTCSQPRMKWDNERLEGFAAAHPEILQFRSEGVRSVAFRWG